MNVPQSSPRETRSYSLSKALSHTGTSVIRCDAEYQVVWAQNLPVSWTSRSIIGTPLASALPRLGAESFLRAGQKAGQSGKSQRIEISVPDPGGLVWFAVWVDCERHERGEIAGYTTTAIDITDQKRGDQALRTLLREVAHRSKNLLAIIQSIATQTGRHSGTIEGFLSRFRGRLHSLASTQDLVTSTNWRGASLTDLVHNQLERYVEDPGRSVDLHVDSIYLSPNAALHIGLALHELTVNSVRFGALSSSGGKVRLVAERHRDIESDALTLEWTEPVLNWAHEPSEKRFGSMALEKVVPASLGGSATLDLSDHRLTYRLTIPSENFERD